MSDLEKLIQQSFKAKSVIANMPTREKNCILGQMSKSLIKDRRKIIEANKKDLNLAKEKKLSDAFIDRLELNEDRINQMASALDEISLMPDPVGEVVMGTTRPNGLRIRQVRVPLGVVLIVYEARPNVTTDAAGLTFKSGNVVVLRGGSNSFNSNKAIVDVLQNVLVKNKLPEEIITFIPKPDRELLNELLKMDQYIDVIIPRGGHGLVKLVVENSRIPVIYHADGICHTFVDATAEKEMAEKIMINAKTQRPGVCNATETLLIHKDYAYRDDLIKILLKNKVEIRGDKEIQKIDPAVKKAVEEDWRTEYLDLIISVKIVHSVEDAIAHINEYSSHHTECIITENYSNAEKFLKEVDSASVFANASTRFSDGGEFGFGAEIGISTQKLHARGPMGLRDLTSVKYIVYGEGQIRE